MNELNQTDLLTNKVESGVLLLRRNEKDFLMRLNMKYLQEFNQNYQMLNSQLQQLKTNLDELDIESAHAVDLKNIVADYQQKFVQLTNKQQTVGLDPESGLYGDLRNAVHQVEDKVNELNNVRLLADM